MTALGHKIKVAENEKQKNIPKTCKAFHWKISSSMKFPITEECEYHKLMPIWPLTFFFL